MAKKVRQDSGHSENVERTKITHNNSYLCGDSPYVHNLIAKWHKYYVT